MTKKIFLICLAVFCLIFLAYFIAACLIPSPFTFVRNEKRASFDASESTKREIYIGGAVEREGYYYYDEGATYLELLVMAGVYSEGVIGFDLQDEVLNSLDVLIVNFMGSGGYALSVNANSSLIGIFSEIPLAVINKITAYKNTHGLFQNKQQLIDLLGEEYSAFIPYFHIGEG